MTEPTGSANTAEASEGQAATSAKGGAPQRQQNRRLVRRTVLWSVLATLLVVVTAAVVASRQAKVRRWFVEQWSKPQPPETVSPFELRHLLLTDRQSQVASGDLEEVAEINATLSHEALLRARAVHLSWFDRRHDKTKLYGQARGLPEWNYRNTAADFFAFHLHAGLRLNPAGMDNLRETLNAEAALRTAEGLCIPVKADTGEKIDTDHDELMFATSEYAKDGLLSVYERYGGDLIGDQLRALVDALIAQSKHPSRFGLIPGQGAEINGNMLQLCGRLSYAMDRPDYAEFSARIADAMIQQAMPANAGLPPKFFNYEANEVVENEVKLKDHGNEAVLGLAEAYAMAVARRQEPAWSQRAATWADPLATMYERILKHGTNVDHLLIATMQPSPPQPTSSDLCDNWGYILSGAILFTDAARRHGQLPADRLAAIDARIDEIARAAFARPNTPWNGSMDSDADAVESAIYMAAYRPSLTREALQWADRQIELLYIWQKSHGNAEQFYLDGNFIRTSFLYADAMSGGWRIEPWRDDVRVGAATDDNGAVVVVVQCGEQPYAGTLVPPAPRYQTVMRLPWNWARLNSWPEWHAVSEGAKVVSIKGFTSQTPPSAAALREGLPLKLAAHGAATIRLESVGQ